MDFGNFDIFAAKDEVAHQERVLTLDPQRVYGYPHNVRRPIRQEENPHNARYLATKRERMGHHL